MTSLVEIWDAGTMQHNHPEVYALRPPKMGLLLELVGTSPDQGGGPGHRLGPLRPPGVLWLMSRKSKEAIAMRLVRLKLPVGAVGSAGSAAAVEGSPPLV